MKPRILFVEDHRPLLHNLSEYFLEENYQLDFASDGLTALNLLATQSYDLVVLDVMLPGVNGVDICRRIRNDVSKTLPILLLTALDSIEHKIAGFGAGADDYLCKPFEMKELELRINALLRIRSANDNILSAGNIHFNPGSLTISTDENIKFALSGLNASLFEMLIRAYPNYVSYENISDYLWGASDVEEHTIRTHIYTLRKTLKKAFGRSLIKGIYGRGYQLDPNMTE